MSDTTNTPNEPDREQNRADVPATETTAASTATPTPTATPATAATITATTTRRPSGKRKLLVIGGSALAAVLLAGGGVAVGAAIADEWGDDDDDETSAVSSRDDDGIDDGRVMRDLGTASADELIEIVEAAAAEADGEAVTVDAGPDGSWDVEFRTEAGDESEVRVGRDGTATLISTEAPDAGDTAPRGTLDAATIEALVAAALDEVDGRIVDLEVDDDATSPYDVSVLTSDGRTVDVALDADLKVLASGVDD